MDLVSLAEESVLAAKILFPGCTGERLVEMSREIFMSKAAELRFKSIDRADKLRARERTIRSGIDCLGGISGSR